MQMVNKVEFGSVSNALRNTHQRCGASSLESRNNALSNLQSFKTNRLKKMGMVKNNGLSGRAADKGAATIKVVAAAKNKPKVCLEEP